MPDEPRVQQLLDELLDSRATPEEVCGSCPELLPRVRERWRQLCRARAELDALFPPVPESDAEFPTAPGAAPPLPRVAGYEVESVLGRGGMGVVFRGLLATFGGSTDATIAERTARACLLRPASDDELGRIVALAARAGGVERTAAKAYYPYCQFAQGLAEYR